jgi:hypothetical protein
MVGSGNISGRGVGSTAAYYLGHTSLSPTWLLFFARLSLTLAGFKVPKHTHVLANSRAEPKRRQSRDENCQTDEHTVDRK